MAGKKRQKAVGLASEVWVKGLSVIDLRSFAKSNTAWLEFITENSRRFCGAEGRQPCCRNSVEKGLLRNQYFRRFEFDTLPLPESLTVV
jgi:hypothetical protein